MDNYKGMLLLDPSDKALVIWLAVGHSVSERFHLDVSCRLGVSRYFQTG